MSKTHKLTNNKTVITLTERIFLTTIFPQRGNILVLRIRRDIMNKIDFSQEEIKKFSLKPVGDSVTYDLKHKDVKLNVEFTDLEKNEIKLALTEMDKKGEMHISMLDLCDKFNVTE